MSPQERLTVRAYQAVSFSSPARELGGDSTLAALMYSRHCSISLGCASQYTSWQLA
jgi:hypothetical protein